MVKTFTFVPQCYFTVGILFLLFSQQKKKHKKKQEETNNDNKRNSHSKRGLSLSHHHLHFFDIEKEERKKNAKCIFISSSGFASSIAFKSFFIKINLKAKGKCFVTQYFKSLLGTLFTARAKLNSLKYYTNKQ